MRIHSEKITTLPLAGKTYRAIVEDHPRTSGWHVKSCLYIMGQEARMVKPSDADDPWEDEHSAKKFVDSINVASLLRMELGLAFEARLLGGLAELSKTGKGKTGKGKTKEVTYWQPGELVANIGTEDIYGSPDGLTRGVWKGQVNPGISTGWLEETKVTWRSSRDNGGIENWWITMAQCKCYCRMMCLTRVRIWALHVNGRYEKGIIGDPELWCHWVDFEQRELDGLWSSLSGFVQRRAGLRLDKGKKG
jgi:hypothetical protein